MTIEEKRNKVAIYCESFEKCSDCILSEGPLCTVDFELATESELDSAISKITNGDLVNHPAHYTDGKIEVIDFIEDKKLGYCLGNVIKYVARAGKKDPAKEVEDLKKAEWYIKRRIKELEEAIV